MKPLRKRTFRGKRSPKKLVLTLVLALSADAGAITLTWDGNGSTAPNPNGGSGTWDTNTTANWWDGALNVVWPALGGNDDDAIFADTAGTVTIAAGGVTADDLTFNTSGYILSGGTLTLNGASSVLTTGAGVTATINSVINPGATGFSKAGAGTLVLGGANTYTGPTAVTEGILRLGNNSALGASSLTTVSSGATLDLAGFSGAGLAISISGTGVGGVGAIHNSNGAIASSISVGAVTLTGDATITNAVAGGDRGKTLSTGTMNLGGNKLTLSSGLVAIGLRNITSGNIDINSGGILLSENGGTQTSVTGTITINAGGLMETRDSDNSAMTSLHTIALNGGRLATATITGNNGGGAGTLLKNNITVDAVNGGIINGNNTAFGINLRLAGNISGSGALTLQGAKGVEFQGDTSGYTGTATVTSGTLFFSPTIASQTFNGIIAGTQPVTKTGVNTTIFAANNTYAGATTVSAGTLVLAGSNTGAGLTSVSSGATLRLDYGANNIHKIGGALTLSGGSVELSGGSFADTVTGTTLTANTSSTVTRSSGSATLNLGAITRNNLSFLNFGQSGIARASNTNNTYGILGTWATVGGSQWAVNDGTGLVVAAATTDLTRLSSGDKTILDGAATHVRLIEGTGTAGNILLGSATTTINTLIQSNVSGTGAAIVDPAGQTLALNAVMVSTGAGALTIGSGTNNGTLRAAGTSLEFVDLAAAGITVNSVIADGTGSSTVTKQSAGVMTFTNENTYSGGTTVIAGTLRASLGNTAGARSIFGTGAITVNSGAIVHFQAGSTPNAMTHANAINLNSGTLLSDDANQTFTGNIALTGANTIQVNWGNKSATLSGTVSGAGSFNKTDAGTLTLSGTNTYTGGTTLTAGTLRAASVGAFGAAGQTLSLNGGTLALGSDTAVSSKHVTMGGNATFTLDRATSGAGFATTWGNLTSTTGDRTLTFAKGANVTDEATLLFNGTLSVSGRTTTFNVGTGANVHIAGSTASGAQTINMVKSGVGTLILSGNNGTWDGGNTTLNGGTLELRSLMGDNVQYRASVTAASDTTLRLAQDTSTNYMSGITAANGMTIESGRINSGTTSMNHSLGTLSLGAATLNVNRASTITGAGIGAVSFTGATTLTGNATTNVGTSAELALQGAVGGAFTLTKSGAGRLVLSGVNTYTGATNVSGGTLLVNGSTVASSAFTVASGATLGGTGNIAGTLNVSGILSPGASIESLSTGAVTMNGGSTFVFEALNNSSTGADLLVSTALQLNGVILDLSLSNLDLNTWVIGDKLTLISYAGAAVTSGFNGFVDNTEYSFGSNTWRFDYNDAVKGNNFNTEATGTQFVTMTMVPEPSTAILGSLGVLALLRRKRK